VSALSDWWDAGPKPRAIDREDAGATPDIGRMEKWKTPGFNGTVTEEHARTYQKPTAPHPDIQETRVNGTEYAQHNDPGRDWSVNRETPEIER